MTTPPPQPPPDPYGQPQPWGQQPPAAPAFFPQQQQPAPYGYPQQPPQGGPGPWGQPGTPPYPQPPRRSRTGLIVGVVAGALVLVAGLGFGAYKLIDAGADAVFPEATHRLVVEEAVLDGEFTLNVDLSDTEGKKIEDTPDPSVRGGKAVVAQYRSEDDDMLVLSGMYGRLSSPGLMRGKIMEGAAAADGAEVVVPPREFEPEGYGITVECQVVRSHEAGLTTNMPMCAWGDGNTAAVVALLRQADLSQDAASLDLEKVAEETAQVRSEIREPLS
ncbi:hypothetical protein [Streptomyces salyersiae]|uniref:Uncharacterized protein n=1 Tax=Streptomyces salyersiae TaxID=3075530 RepID=A0ABU2RL53_9ACTN|nr:hypothetical protein [Streptomyces sp. DSM 41770]MDT0429003.1 hypothetical protein [Streptomyces sp. DSM 41770]